MAEDFDQKRSGAAGAAGTPGGRPGGNEDPLIELARMVHNNKQTGAPVSSGRVGSTDYFAALEDIDSAGPKEPGGVASRVEPSFGTGPAQPAGEPGIAGTSQASAPPLGGAASGRMVSPGLPDGQPDLGQTPQSAADADLIQSIQQPSWPDVPSLESIESIASEALNRAVLPTGIPQTPVQTPVQGQVTGYRQPDPASQPAAGPGGAVGSQSPLSDNLERNLTAGLEDELIGAMRQSVDPASAGPTGLPSELGEEDHSGQWRDLSAPAALADLTDYQTSLQPEVRDWESRSAESQSASMTGYGRLGPSGSGAAAPEAPAEQFADPDSGESQLSAGAGTPRPAINEADLFAALTGPAASDANASDGGATASSSQTVAGLDTLLADLDFPDPAARQQSFGEDQRDVASPLSGYPAEGTGEPRQPAPGPDIDNMTWPAAAAAVPRVVEDETPPPPEGYDLDAVARAMQESDPSLNGAGVLPPHSAAEQAVVPHAEERSRRGLFVAGGVLGLAAIGAAGFFFLDGGGTAVPDGPPPVIIGLQEPLKVLPEEADGAGADQSAKLIYDRVDGISESTPERLPERETPELASLPPAPANAGNGAELVPGAPRRVRTVVVRPDGTIVSGQNDQSASAGGVAPEPATPLAGARSVETTPITNGSGLASVPSPSIPTPSVPTTVTTTIPVPVSPADVAALPSSARPQPVAAANGASSQTTPPVPVPTVVPLRKPDAPVRVAQAPAASGANNGPLNLTQTAATPAPTQNPAPASSGTVPAGTYIVQVSSQRSAAAAQSAYDGLQSRFPAILGSREAAIASADLGDRGTFYRAGIPTASRDEAIRLCEQLKGAGGDCFVRQAD